MQNTTVRKWVILFLILLFPSLLYVFLSTGKHQIIRLPHFGPKEFIAEPGKKRVDTTYYSIPSFVLIDQNQTEVSLSTIDKNTKVFSFICIDCENSPSKRILAELAQLQLQFEKRTDLKFITLVVDAENVDSLKYQNFIQESNPSASLWKICKTENQLAKNFATNSLLIEDYSENKGSSFFVIIDRNNHIRGYYNGAEYLEVKEMIDAIKVLKAEEFIPKKNS